MLYALYTDLIKYVGAELLLLSTRALKDRTVRRADVFCAYKPTLVACFSFLTMIAVIGMRMPVIRWLSSDV